jgi:hypothetical protein
MHESVKKVKRGMDRLELWKAEVDQEVKRFNPAFNPRPLDSSDEDDTKTIPASRKGSSDDELSPPGRPMASVVMGTSNNLHATLHMHHEMPLALQDQSAYVSGLDHVSPQHPDQDDDNDREPGPPVDPEQPKLVLNHTTKASLLLEWLAIEKLCGQERARLGVRFVSEFPIRQEEKRGLIRLYGRGEGVETRLGARENEHHGVVDAPIDDTSEAASPPSDCWGGIGSMSPLSNPETGDRLRAFKALDFSPHVVKRYVESYTANIQNMLPIILPQDLDYIVARFLEAQVGRQGQSRDGHTAPTPTSAPIQDATGIKRKRSPDPEADDYASLINQGFRPQRSIQTAIMLLILALGKICLYTGGKLPNVVSDEESRIPVESPYFRNGGVLGQSAQSSPPAPSQQSQSSGLPSPEDVPDRPDTARRTSQFGSGQPRHRTLPKKNYEVIPGLDYFAVATDILGNQLGAHTLPHVYAAVLAGLYHGQLGRVMESYHYIARASLTLHGVLRP